MIRTKADMYTLYERGAFGNKLTTWPDLESMAWNHENRKVCVRYKQPGSKWYAFGLSASEAIRFVQHSVHVEGAKIELFRFNEQGPDDRIVLQGELLRDHRSLVLSYSYTPSIMHRNAMKLPGTTMGLHALEILRTCLSPASYDDLMGLLDIYPDSVIEFTAYSVDVGICRGRNAVVWEVRNY